MVPPVENIWLAFALTLLAGLATGLGSIIAFTFRRSGNFLSVSLGFSAGVMIYVSFVEIIPESLQFFQAAQSEHAELWTTLAFFFGVFLIMVIDFLVPEKINPHEYPTPLDSEDETEEERNRRCIDLYNCGRFSALAVAIHNFPEGMATFMAALVDPKLGIGIAIAIAIHNIPEGVAIAVPVYYATGNIKRASLMAFLSGLSEPLGALVGFFVLRNFLSNTMFGIVFAMVAGIMVYISIDELLPTAEKYGEHHYAIGGVVAGMAVIAISMLLIGN
ncbi:MAG TPA: zinc transporter ZupT [Clostridiaceae bacterium]|nr:zinc transporter ZupT [Clostridiaceae bacterium]